MSLKQFEFTVKNTRTQESACFLGQGETVADAFKDGSANCAATFRPSTSGAKRHEHGMAVTLQTGEHVNRTLKEFEGDVPYRAEQEEV